MVIAKGKICLDWWERTWFGLLARRYVCLLTVVTTANAAEIFLIQTTKIAKVRDNYEKLHRETGTLQQWQGFDLFCQRNPNPIDPAVPVLDLNPVNGVVMILAKVIIQSDKLVSSYWAHEGCSHWTEESGLSTCLPLQFRFSKWVERAESGYQTWPMHMGCWSSCIG